MRFISFIQFHNRFSFGSDRGGNPKGTPNTSSME